MNLDLATLSIGKYLLCSGSKLPGFVWPLTNDLQFMWAYYKSAMLRERAAGPLDRDKSACPVSPGSTPTRGRSDDSIAATFPIVVAGPRHHPAGGKRIVASKPPPRRLTSTMASSADHFPRNNHTALPETAKRPTTRRAEPGNQTGARKSKRGDARVRGALGPKMSVSLDTGGPDHIAPLLGFVGDELAKVGR
jgi:hypothetical protein